MHKSGIAVTNLLLMVPVSHTPNNLIFYVPRKDKHVVIKVEAKHQEKQLGYGYLAYFPAFLH